MMARVPVSATPASAAETAPNPESTASAPAMADWSAAASGAARSTLTTRNPFRVAGSFAGLRTTAVT